MKIIDMICLTAMFLFLTVPWFVAGLNIWGWLFVIMALCVLGFEIYSVATKGKTISRRFWEFRKEHPRSAYGILACMTIGYLLLVFHLLC